MLCKSTVYQKVMMNIFIKGSFSGGYCNKLQIYPLYPPSGPQGLTPDRDTTADGQHSGAVCVSMGGNSAKTMLVLFSAVIATLTEVHGGDLTMQNTQERVETYGRTDTCVLCV